jgi:hypothetical protein
MSVVSGQSTIVASSIFGFPVCPALNPNGVCELCIEEFNSLCRKELDEIISYLFGAFDPTTPYGRGIITRFFNTNSIRVKFLNSNPWIIKIKYGDNMVAFTAPWMLSCRGDVFRVIRSGPSVHVERLSTCPVKFFNAHEIQRVYGYNYIELLANGGEAAMKEDGSAITLCTIDGELHASTLGSWGETKMQVNSVSFSVAAKGFVPASLKDLLTKEDICLFTELVTRNNVICSKYSSEFLSLLHASKRDGSRLSEVLYDEVRMIFESTSGLRVAPRRAFKDHDELKKIFDDTEAMDPDCENPEGIVIYIQDIPMIKLKRAEYLASLRDNVCMSLNYGSIGNMLNIDNWYFHGKSDDLCTHSLEFEYLDKLKGFIAGVLGSIDTLIDAMSEIDPEGNYARWSQDRKTHKPSEESKNYAIYVKNMTLPSGEKIPDWLRNFLFARCPTDIGGAWDFLSFCMLNDGLSIAHKNGPLALEKNGGLAGEREESRHAGKDLEKINDAMHSFAVVFDCDGTLWEPPSPPLGKKDGWWEREESLDVTFYPRMMRLIAGYMYSGIPVFIVTGRKRHLHTLIEKLITKELCKYVSDSLVNFTLFTSPKMSICKKYPSTRHVKGNVYRSIKTGFSNVLVFDDNMDSAYAAVDTGCSLIKCLNGEFRYPDEEEKNMAEIIGICGIPGSGKTTVMKILKERLDKEGTKYIYISTDQLNTNGDGKDLMGTLRNAVTQPVRYVLLDTTFCSNSIFKTIGNITSNFRVFTWMPTMEIAGKKGVPLVQIDPHFVITCIHRTRERVGHENIGQDVDANRKIIVNKSVGASGVMSKCVNVYPQLNQLIGETYSVNKNGKVSIPNVSRVTPNDISDIYKKVNHLIPLSQELANLVYDKMVSKDEETPKDEEIIEERRVNYYRALVFPNDTFSPPFFESLKVPDIPHITIKHGVDILEGSESVGRDVLFTPVYIAAYADGEVVRVMPTEDLPDSAHVTIGYRNKPHDAWRALSGEGELESLQVCDIEQVSVRGVEVFLM